MKNGEKESGGEFVKWVGRGWEVEEELNDEKMNKVVDS